MIRSFIFGVLMCSVYTAGAQSLHSNAHIGFIYPLSTNGTQAAEYSNKFSMHALGGLSKNEEAVALYGVAGVVRDTARGYMASGVVSIVGKAVDGCQMGGCVNYAGGNVHGFQAAGFINVAGSVDGAQAGGFANVALTRVNGLQAAGFINTADTALVQLGGFVNVASHSGVQVAGFVNKANDVDGSQIAGFINVGRKVKGVQIAGFVNIADSCDYPIGLINITRNGEQAIGVTVNEIGTTLATFRSGGRVLYGIIGIGGNGTGGYRAYALQGGIGAHFPISPLFRFNAEVSVTSLSDRWFNTDIRSGIRIMPALRLGHMELFAGPSFNYTLSNDIQGVGRVGYSIWDYHSRYMSHNFSVGAEAGIQLHLDSHRFFEKVFPKNQGQQ